MGNVAFWMTLTPFIIMVCMTTVKKMKANILSFFYFLEIPLWGIH